MPEREYTLPFPPVGSNTHKHLRQREYAELCRSSVPGTPVTCDVIAYVLFNPPETEHFIKYDLDNLLKPTLDALKGIAYYDDNQVRCIHAAFGSRCGSGSVSLRIVPLIRRRKNQ